MIFLSFQNGEKKVPIHAIADLLIFTVVLGSTVYMAFLGGNSEELSAPGWKIFRYFTVDSNVLMGITSLITVIFYFFSPDESREIYPNWLSVLNLVSVASVFLTFSVVALYLGPISGNYFALFKGANFAFHFFVPILATAKFIFFERAVSLTFSSTFFCILPPFLYAVYYAVPILRRMHDGIEITRDVDWYGFYMGNIPGVVVVIVLILSLAFGLGVLIRWASAVAPKL